MTRDPLQNIKLWVQGKTKREVDAGSTPQGVMQRLGNALASFELNISSCEKSIARLQDQLASAKVEAEKPWPQEDEYQIKVERLNELNFLLSKKDAKIGIPAPSACSLGTTLPEFQPHFHALKPQCLIIGLAQPYCD